MVALRMPNFHGENTLLLTVSVHPKEEGKHASENPTKRQIPQSIEETQ
jgi:hypothetical protein